MPIGRYTAHCFKRVLSLACKAMLYLLHFVIQVTISVCSAISVQHKLQVFNKKIEDNSLGLDAPLYRKVDIDNLFSKIKH